MDPFGGFHIYRKYNIVIYNVLVMDKQQLNALVWKRWEDYFHFKVGKAEVRVPYFTNHVGKHWGEIMNMGGLPKETIKNLFKYYNSNTVPWGWYRGKGTPELLVEAVIKIAEMRRADIEADPENFSEEMAKDYMKLFGLGIDCSGLVYNLLDYALCQSGQAGKIEEIIDWHNQTEKTVYKAGAYTFAGEASVVIKPEEAAPLDLILLKRKDGTYLHVVMLLTDPEGELVIVQSTSTAAPMGVRSDKWEMTDGQPRFDFKPEIGDKWEDLWVEGRLEFRRLREL
jgi:hypothetical protein